MILTNPSKKTKEKYKPFDIQLVNLLVSAFKEINENNDNLTTFVGGESVDDIINRIGMKS